MRGKLAKKLRKAAREICPSGWADRALAELNGTRRQREIKNAHMPLPDTDDIIERAALEAMYPKGYIEQDVKIETFTVVNHPTSYRSRYRLLKQAYMKARYDHV